MKRKAKILVICSLLMGFYAVSDAQDYYGNNGGSWRRKPDNSQPPPKDEGSPIPSGFLSINFGFATPQGGFSNSAGNGYGGYAESGGFIFDFSLGVPINHSNFGVAFMFGSYDNSYDLNTFANNNGVYALPANTGQTDYSESSILGGLFATYPVGRLSIDGRLMVGALLNNLPEQNIGFLDAAGNEWEYDIQPTDPASFAFDVGVGARFMIAQLGRRKLCLMVNLDYLYSNVSYNTQQYQYETYASGVNAGQTFQYIPSPTVAGHLPIELLNLTFGIGYQL